MRKDVAAPTIHLTAHPQLECFCDVEGVCEAYGPSEIVCLNRNPETEAIPFWTCEPVNWSSRHHIVESDILCEGWDNKTDPYILEGSCRIKVRMAYDWVQDQVDESIFPLIFCTGLLAIVCLLILTGYVWTETWGNSRIEAEIHVEEVAVEKEPQKESGDDGDQGN